jgi:N6-adenosine-specific RNA methylase IME4
MADRKYPAILLDCPWDPQPRSYKGKGRHPSAYYDVMSLKEIAALPVKNYAAKSCWVFCWVVAQFLDFASYELPRAWGCEYSSVAFTWFKTAKRLGRQLPLFLIADNKEFPMGQGHTTRKVDELCLLFRFGQPRVADKGVPDAIFAPRRANSQKPDEQYALIERFVGVEKRPFLEFFSRRRRPGWDVVYSPEADTGPGKRRWRANTYPEVVV